MLKELATVAAYGASASFGRDVYRSTKKENPIIYLIIALFLSITGFHQLVKGHDRGVIGTVFLTLIGSMLMIVLGCLCFGAAFMFVASYTDVIRFLSFKYRLTLEQLSIISILGYVAVSALVGVPWGLSDRNKRAQAIYVEQRNEEFLVNLGFEDPGLGEGILQDRDGNRLKLREQDEGQLVFTVVGRRNMRAAIRLDEDGRMREYTGAVKL